MARVLAIAVTLSPCWLAWVLVPAPVLCAAEGQDFMASSQSAKTQMATYIKSMQGFKDKAKQALCKAMPVEALCGKSVADAEAPACTGPACCAKSSCYSQSLPGFRCDFDRGATTCVGLKFFGSKGVCKCKSGICDTNGHCTTNTAAPPDFSNLYEEGNIVPPEDFTGPMLLMLGVVSIGLVVSCAAVVRRSGRWGGGFGSGSQMNAEALIEDAGEYVE